MTSRFKTNTGAFQYFSAPCQTHKYGMGPQSVSSKQVKASQPVAGGMTPIFSVQQEGVWRWKSLVRGKAGGMNKLCDV
jgi:hypothetical protein